MAMILAVWLSTLFRSEAFYPRRQGQPGSHRNASPEERRTRTKPDHEQTSEMGDAKEAGGDEGKGNAASVELLLGG